MDVDEAIKNMKKVNVRKAMEPDSVVWANEQQIARPIHDIVESFINEEDIPEWLE